MLLTDPEPLLYHGEVVYRDGVVVGDIRAASYGHTLGGAVGLSMVQGGGADAGEPIDSAWVNSGALRGYYEVSAWGRSGPCAPVDCRIVRRSNPIIKLSFTPCTLKK